MTDDGNPQGTPPASPTPPGSAPDATTTSGTTTTATPPSPREKPASVSPAMLIWVGIAVVLLSFVAAFLGSWLADSNEPTAAAADADAHDRRDRRAAYEEAIEEILPAGSAVRAGTGVPEAGKGYEGDVYIDISTSDVYLFQDGDWTLVGNIRTSAAENLTGATGAAGETGATGRRAPRARPARPGDRAPGAPGTQVLLGVGAPQTETCTADGDIYIDTVTVSFYECSAGDWTLFGPPTRRHADPEPTESPPRADPPSETGPRPPGCRSRRSGRSSGGWDIRLP